MAPLVPTFLPMVTLAPKVPLAAEKRSGFSGYQWHHWLPMVPLVNFQWYHWENPERTQRLSHFGLESRILILM